MTDFILIISDLLCKKVYVIARLVGIVTDLNWSGALLVILLLIYEVYGQVNISELCLITDCHQSRHCIDIYIHYADIW